MDEKEFFSELEALREGRMRLSSSTLKERNDALGLVSDALEKNKDWIFSENRKDIVRSAYHRLKYSGRIRYTKDILNS